MIDLLLWLYLFLILLNGVMLFFAKKFFTPVNLFYLGNVIYGAPLFFKENYFIYSYLNYGKYTEAIPVEIYVIYILSMLTVSMVLLFESKTRFKQFKGSFLEDRHTSWALVGLQLGFFALLMLSLKLDFVRLSKHDLIPKLGVLYLLTSISSVFCLMFYAARKISFRSLLALPSLCFLLVDLVMGYRTTTFLGLCSCVAFYFYSRGFFASYMQRYKMTVLGLVAIFSALIFKPVYYSLKLGGLSNLKFTSDTSFMGSEPFVIMGTFSKLLHEGHTVFSERSFESILQYFPLSRTLFGVERYSLNQHIQGQVFHDTEWGLASSGYGSLYVEFWWFGILVYLAFCFWYCRLWGRLNLGWLSLGYYFMTPFVLFYFHRNDWFSFLGQFKILCLYLVCVAGVSCILLSFEAKTFDRVLKFASSLAWRRKA